MNWLLDTGVICQPGKRHGDSRVVAWLEREKNQCCTSAVVIAQLAYWVRTKEGRQRQALARAVVQRVLHEPTVRMKELRDDRVHARMQLVRDLFGLDPDAAPLAAPEAEDLAEVRELPRRRRASAKRER